jgi:hypothetical protein
VPFGVAFPMSSTVVRCVVLCAPTFARNAESVRVTSRVRRRQRGTGQIAAETQFQTALIVCSGLSLAWWHDGTMSIRSSHDGAMGSTLLRSAEATMEFVGVARWKSQEHLARFRRTADTLRFPGATLETIEVLDEIDDLTIHG